MAGVTATELQAASVTEVDTLRAAAHPIHGERRDYDALIERVGEARIVLLGESTHGSHELYRERARITRRLVAECDFDAVAIAASWADAYDVNRYVHGAGDVRDANLALRSFRRFPEWLWRNAETVEFISWLRQHNTSVARKAGFYGLDLYNLSRSTGAAISYLAARDADSVQRARARYECLQSFAEDSAGYGSAVLRDLPDAERDAVIEELTTLRREAAATLREGGFVGDDERFFEAADGAAQSAAPDYYRTIFGERTASWNLRDRHLADMLDGLLDRAPSSRVVLWAHNSHVGDARRTHMARRDEQNLGQILRERHGNAVVSVGFTTYVGSVTAASAWGGPPERKHVRRALPESHEALLHETQIPAFLLCPLGAGPAGAALRAPRLERAIGVIYSPDRERASHYFEATLADQFDALVHVDQTTALEPLDEPVATSP